MPATPEDIHAAALDAVADVLASEAGPDGKPSPRAVKKARRILRLLEDPEALEDLSGSVAEGRRRKKYFRESCVPNQTGPGHHDDQTGYPCSTGGQDGGGTDRRDKEQPADPHVSHASKDPGTALNYYMSDLASELADGSLKPADAAEKVQAVVQAAKDRADDSWTDVAQKLDRDWKAKYGPVVGEDVVEELSERMAHDMGEESRTFHAAADKVNRVFDRVAEQHGQKGRVSPRAAERLEQAGIDADDAHEEFVTNVKHLAGEYEKELVGLAEEKWGEDADGLAGELNGEAYEDDPEARAEDMANHNERLEQSGNPYRLYLHDSGEVVWDHADKVPKGEQPG